MSRRTWQLMEQRSAQFMNPGKGRRNPLSGRTSGHDSGDGLNIGRLYKEDKGRQKWSVWTIHEDTRAEAKKVDRIPVTILHKLDHKGFLVVVHSSDLDEFMAEVTEMRRSECLLKK